MPVQLDSLNVDLALLPVPPMTPGAAEHVHSTDEVAAVIAAYYYPTTRAEAPHAAHIERRQNGTCSLAVFRDTGVVCSVRWLDKEPDYSPPPQRRSHGGRGNVWPTTWAELRRRLTDRKCTVEPGGKHWRVTLPDGAIFTLSCTASDWRSLRNAALQLRARGVDVST